MQLAISSASSCDAATMQAPFSRKLWSAMALPADIRVACCETRWARSREAVHPSHLRGNHRHAQSGRQRISAARHVATNGLERANQLACTDSRRNGTKPLLWLLPLAKTADVVDRHFGGFFELRRDTIQGGCHLFAGNPEGRSVR